MDKTYIAISFDGLDAQQQDLLTGMLDQAGYYGFETGDQSLKAYIEAADFDEDILTDISRSLHLSWQKTQVKEENWNAQWEQSFEPVQVPGKVAVRAAFHPPVEGVELEIVITPKMSFGTGHHATTWMMMDMMTRLDFEQKTVLDFGTGTGILAILAEKRGARSVDAMDNDPWCIENTRENIEGNDCHKIRVTLADQVPAEGSYDIVLANINRNFLLDHARAVKKLVKPGGFLLLSGILTDDASDIENAYLPLGSQPIERQEKNNWVGLTLRY